MLLADLLGAALTVLALFCLALGGYGVALLLLAEEARRDRLALAVATLVALVAEAVAIGLALGAAGRLRPGPALALAAGVALVVLLRLRARPPAGDVGAPLAALAAALARRLRQHPALSLVVLHAAGSEALRGLLRPPLAWDSLMYHLPLAATWLFDGDLAPVFGRFPMTLYGYFPANGEVWLWWWLAPSHGELWVNLAFFPQWLLLVAATGGVARELGARRLWPVAGLLVAVTPVAARLVATQYVDIQLAALLVAATFLGLRWRAEPRACWALLAGAALGLAAGTKVLGPPYGLALGLALAASARGRWWRRSLHLSLAAIAAALLGSFFYLRNVAAGVGPLALPCSQLSEGGSQAAGLAGPHTVAALAPRLLADGSLLDTLLGVAHPLSLEMGLGPQAVLLLAACLALLPWALARGPRLRLPAIVVWSQMAVQGMVWAVLPYADRGHVFANLRYALAAVGLAFAAALALAESRRVRPRWLGLLALALAVQSLLQLHAEMPRGARLALALGDGVAALLILAPCARDPAWRWRRPLAVLAAGAALLAVPPLAQFRRLDRGRAFAQERTLHDTPARSYAGAWAWLDAFGGNGTVAVSTEPPNRFVYPAMGPDLERRALYVNVNSRDHRQAARYPGCNPRVEPSAEAWMRNLEKAGVVWIHLGHDPGREFPLELGFVEAQPERFALHYHDQDNRIYQLLPPTPGP